MNLIVDQGNTQIKIAVYNNNNCKYLTSVKAKGFKVALNKVLDQFKVEKSILSTVVTNSNLWAILGKNLPFLELNDRTLLPFANQYLTPETLGKDRLAAIAGAYFLVGNKPILCIDAGTAVTFDYYQPGKGYLGGAISPGLNMRSKAMNSFTSALPEVELKPQQLIGADTESCLQSGIYNGLLMEIEGRIKEFKEGNSAGQVFLTGGDSSLFDKKLKNTIFAEPNLVLTGLNSLLEYNV